MPKRLIIVSPLERDTNSRVSIPLAHNYSQIIIRLISSHGTITNQNPKIQFILWASIVPMRETSSSRLKPRDSRNCVIRPITLVVAVVAVVVSVVQSASHVARRYETSVTGKAAAASNMCPSVSLVHFQNK